MSALNHLPVIPSAACGPVSTMRPPLARIACLLALAWPAWAAAATGPDDVGRVEVLGSATGTALGGGARYVINSDDLAALGARTLDQALALVPGLNVRNGAEGVPRIDIRGLRTRQVRLLIDGVPFNGAADGQFDPTLIPMALIDSIIVRTGATSVLYGEGGTAGTIEIVTRRGVGPASGMVSLQGGSGSSGIASAQIGGAVEAWNYSIGAELAEQDGMPLSAETVLSSSQPAGLRSNSDARRRNAQGRLGWRASNALQVALQVTTTQADRGSPPSAVTDSADTFAQKPRYDRTENLQAVSAQLSATWAATPDAQLRGWLYTTAQEQDDRRYDNAALALLQDKTLKGGFDLQGATRTQGLHLQGGLALGSALSLSAAVDSRREQLDQTGRIRDVAVTSGGGTGGGTGGGKGGGTSTATTTYNIRNVNEGHAAHVDSVSAELAWRPTLGPQLVGGLGWVQQQRESSSRSASMASLGLVQALGDAFSVRAAVSRRVRAPSLTQLYDATSGNAALQLERTAGAELGLDWRSSVASAQATLFHNNVRDLIRNDDSTGRAANIDHVVFQGLELQGQWQLSEAWRIAPSFTWLHSDNRSTGALFSTLAYTPEHRLGLDLRWQALPTLALSTSLLHVRSQVADARSGLAQQTALPDYTLLGLQAAWRLPVATLTLRVDNALDKAWSTSYGFPQPGRTASLRADFRF